MSTSIATWQSNGSFAFVTLEPQSGTAAANTITPRYIGDEYLKTDTSVTYVAKGLSTSDWVESINAASIQTLTNKTLTAPIVDTVNAAKFKITPEGGYAIKLTNRTGAVSVKGYLLEASDTYDDAAKLLPIDTPSPIGVVYEAGIADGAEMWVVVSGIAEVYYVGNVTRGTFARMTWTGDTGVGAGKAIAEAIPSSPFASDKHFAEIGHPIQSRTGAGLARTVLHFN